jgi:hypothetical protein
MATANCKPLWNYLANDIPTQTREMSRLEEIANIARSALDDDTFTYSLASLEQKILAVPMEIDKGHDKRDFRRSVLKIQKEGGLTERERKKAECILKDWQDETNRNNTVSSKLRHCRFCNVSFTAVIAENPFLAF